MAMQSLCEREMMVNENDKIREIVEKDLFWGVGGGMSRKKIAAKHARLLFFS